MNPDGPSRNGCRRPRILALLWGSCLPILDRIKDTLDEDVEYHSLESMAASGMTPRDFIGRMGLADVTVINLRNNDESDELERLIEPVREGFRIISFGSDPSKWALTTVDHRVAVGAYRYLTCCGDENLRRMFDYIAKALLGKEGEPLEPEELPWQGIVGIESGAIYDSLEEYEEAEDLDPDLPYVGVLASRTNLTMDGLRIERDTSRDLAARGVNPVLVFSTWSPNDEGSRSISDNIRRYFFRKGRCAVDAVVKFSSGFLGESGGDGPQYEGAAELLKEMNVSVCQPIITARMSEREWRESGGLTSDIAWQISYPEFEGVTDPLVIGSDVGTEPGTGKDRVSYVERRGRLADRVVNRVRLHRIPNSEKRVLILLNNFPCNGVEGNVGNASGLDSLESVADLLKRMRDAGYSVDPPEDGEDLIRRILDSKALSEFRWTTAEEMVRCGGVLHEMDADEYGEYFSSLPESIRRDVTAAWGEPPGEGMVLDGRILITGVSFGNAVVAVQPKRGCFGSRCDGHVCRILHDPLCPPTHQFLATYHYYEHIWKVDAVIHTGTHGSMEWTPGKGTGLTECCYPDICISDSPHLYIYNSDNPAEGVIAKRRALATLVDHMQDVMTGVELYGGYTELEDLLSQYPTSKDDPARAEALRSAIASKVSELHMEDCGVDGDTALEDAVRRCHEALSRMTDSQTNRGLHVLGRVPEGDDMTDTVYSVMRYGNGEDSLRDSIAGIEGLDLTRLLNDPGGLNADGTSFGQTAHRIDREARRFTECVLSGMSAEEALVTAVPGADPRYAGRMGTFADIITDIRDRAEGSDEIGAVLNGLDGGYVPAGPSGYMTRGRYDILPTGRNFFFMDPETIPTRTAWATGRLMAEKTVERYVSDNGEMPESIGMFWNMSEIVSTGGEVMSQMMCLIGTRPVWHPDGRLKGFDIIPLEELGRPRVDITVNVSGILRDNMMHLVDLLDEAVTAVAALDEPPDMNFVRRHTLASIADGMSEEDAVTRFFGAAPGAYTSGISLAVFASAWNDESDLANLYVQMKGHGYGGGRNGRSMYEQFAASLSRTDAAYDCTRSDESDLLSCSCHFSNIGGMITASRYLSGKDVRAYYGDTRDPHRLSVGDLSDEFRRVMRVRTLNPQWIEGMKQHGYKGAMDIVKRVTRLYGWQATTHEVDDWLFDEAVNTLVKNEDNRRFFAENNPYALEEMSRRLLEANSRGLWDTDSGTLEALQETYLELESVLEEGSGDGEYQGGCIDEYLPSDRPPEVETAVRNMTDRLRRSVS